MFLSTRLSPSLKYPVYVKIANGDCVIPANRTRKRMGGYIAIRRSGKEKYMHRLSYECYKGIIPLGMDVLHRCDNPPCINPQHLYLGTDKENAADCVRRNRSAIGEKNSQAKLTAKEVRKIRELWQTGIYTKRHLGEFFGVSRDYIKDITHKRYWKHI